jgi:hypothetical protein
MMEAEDESEPIDVRLLRDIEEDDGLFCTLVVKKPSVGRFLWMRRKMG